MNPCRRTDNNTMRFNRLVWAICTALFSLVLLSYGAMASTNDNSSRISLSVQDANLQDILYMISRAAESDGISIHYNAADFDSSHIVSVNVDNEPWKTVLAQLLAKYDFAIGMDSHDNYVISKNVVSEHLGQNLRSALFKAGNRIAGTEGYYEALAPFVTRNSTNEIGRLTSIGIEALKQEFNAIKIELMKTSPPLDLETELSLASDFLKFQSVREIPKFSARLSRICALVGRLITDGYLTDSMTMFRCYNLEMLIIHHGIRAYLPREEAGLNGPSDNGVTQTEKIENSHSPGAEEQDQSR